MFLCSMLSLTRLIQKRPRHAAAIFANRHMPMMGTCLPVVVPGVVASAALVANLVPLAEALDAASLLNPEVVRGDMSFQVTPTLSRSED